MSAKIHKLSFDLEDDYKLIGIVSTENDYKLSWILNQLFDIQLIREDSLEIFSSKHPVALLFSLYQFYDETEMINYNLISNKNSEGVFLDEHKNIDYILKISGETEFFDIDKTIRQIKDSDNIITVIKIDKNSLKKESINRLNLE